LVVMNRSSLLGIYRNGWAANILGLLVVAIAAGLGIFKLMQVASLV